jgi:hypothetical protein
MWKPDPLKITSPKLNARCENQNILCLNKQSSIVWFLQCQIPFYRKTIVVSQDRLRTTKLRRKTLKQSSRETNGCCCCFRRRTRKKSPKVAEADAAAKELAEGGEKKSAQVFPFTRFLMSFCPEPVSANHHRSSLKRKAMKTQNRDSAFFVLSGTSDPGSARSNKAGTPAATPVQSGAGAAGGPRGRGGFKDQIRRRLVPALRAFHPDMILLSAGFDGASCTHPLRCVYNQSFKIDPYFRH